MFMAAFTFALLPLLAAASPNPQIYGPPPPGPATSAPAAAPSAPPSTQGQINIDVGAGGNFVFNPTNVTAPNGTLITFFFPGGDVPHSVTQGDFSNPCQPIAAQGGQNGFDSGLQNSVQWTLNVTNDQEPIYFFCKSPTHCGLGMVGYVQPSPHSFKTASFGLTDSLCFRSINAPSTGNTFDAWQAAAVKVGASEQTLQDNGPVTGGIGAIATASPTATASGSSGSSGSGALQLSASSALAVILGVVAGAMMLVA
ncbi:hypothetical protein LXA43DRAFT_473974 [Ganoderma leucocontextum]|nr:hypothetical protein LXA43DRAFT_473974 [Ganoderma leucocontextum]